VLFQTLDNKKECYGIYLNGDLIYDEFPDNLTNTWSYSSFLKGKGVEYANLYCGNKTLSEACPPQHHDEWEEVSGKLKAFLRSFYLAKVDLDENCFFDLVPDKFLRQHCEIKNKITKHVLENYEKPKNYDFLVELIELVDKIAHQKLSVNTDTLKSKFFQFKTRKFSKKINTCPPYIKYNIFGTKTGRLTTRKNSFPILTMDKNYRSILKPQNDWYIELDYNAAELRTLLNLLGKEQPKDDLHEWNAKNVYRGSITREEAKKRMFAWLYNPNSKDHLSNRAYQRNDVLKKYWNGTHVQTIYDRKIIADKHHALNYIIQSTFSDLLLRQAIKIDKLLEGKKTNIAFMIHDSIILDMAHEDEMMISEIFHEFAETDLGVFLPNCTAGKNFGEMKKLWIQL